jgi:hypothetical protein
MYRAVTSLFLCTAPGVGTRSNPRCVSLSLRGVPIHTKFKRCSRRQHNYTTNCHRASVLACFPYQRVTTYWQFCLLRHLSWLIPPWHMNVVCSSVIWSSIRKHTDVLLKAINRLDRKKCTKSSTISCPVTMVFVFYPGWTMDINIRFSLLKTAA